MNKVGTSKTPYGNNQNQNNQTQSSKQQPAQDKNATAITNSEANNNNNNKLTSDNSPNSQQASPSNSPLKSTTTTPNTSINLSASSASSSSPSLTTSSSSACSTTPSNSPSPNLLNTSSNNNNNSTANSLQKTTPRIESPLAANSKSTFNNLQIKILPDTGNAIATSSSLSSSSSSSSSTSSSSTQLTTGVSVITTANAALLSPKTTTMTSTNNTSNLPLSARVNPSEINSKSDNKQIKTPPSSLLSTTAPAVFPQTTKSSETQLSHATNPSTTSNQPTDFSKLPNTTSTNKDTPSSTSLITTAKTSSEANNSSLKINLQPTIPPLTIPILPQTTKGSKPTPKTSKSSSKGATTRKKSTETNEQQQPPPAKPEPKPKASRSKKNTTTATNPNTKTTSNTKPKPTTPKRGKSRAAASKQVDNTTTNVPTISSDTPSVNRQASSTSPPAKRKSRSTSNESTSGAGTAATTTAAGESSPAKRARKKKTDPPKSAQTNSNNNKTSATNNSLNSTTANMTNNPQFITTGPTLLNNGPIKSSPLMINTPIPNSRYLTQGFNSVENQDLGNRYFSPIVSPYGNYDNLTAPSLSRGSISRLITTSGDINNANSSQDDIGKAFEELRENTWSNLSKCVLEQAQQFDVPSLIGTLYTLRTENEKLVNRVKELTMKRDQLIAMNARLDLPGPMLTQHLNNTSPNFSAVLSGLTNSPKGLTASSPGSSVIGGKQAMTPHPLGNMSSYNHIQTGNPLGPSGYLDTNSPISAQSHSGINNIKSASISTPSPPIGAIMAHSNSNRAGLITVNNPPFMPNVYPPMNTLGPLGANPHTTSSFYPRQ